MDADASPPGSEDARDALESIGLARRRLASVKPPVWLYWSLAGCMVVEGFVAPLTGWERTVVQLLVMATIFAVSFAAQRHSGMVTRLTRPPARPLRVWVAFVAVVAVTTGLTAMAARAGYGPLACFVLAGLFVLCGPRLGAFWRGGL